MLLSLYLTVIACLLLIEKFRCDFAYSATHMKEMQRANTKCIDIVQYFLKRASFYNDELFAMTNLNSKAEREAHALDNYYFKNKAFVGRLHCVPIIVKDNIDVIGMPTTGGINALRNSIPNKDSTVIKRLKDKGAIIIGKTNMAEVIFTKPPIISDKSEIGGQCHNPFDFNRACGSSSTGINNVNLIILIYFY